jgi:hypothetical protein
VVADSGSYTGNVRTVPHSSMLGEPSQ